MLEYFEDVAVRSARQSHLIPAVCRVRFYVKVNARFTSVPTASLIKWHHQASVAHLSRCKVGLQIHLKAFTSWPAARLEGGAAVAVAAQHHAARPLLLPVSGLLACICDAVPANESKLLRPGRPAPVAPT